MNLTTFCKQTWRGGVSLSVLLFCQTNRRFARFYLPKFLLVGLLWVVAVTLASWQEYNELHDPTYYYRLDATNFMVRVCVCVCVMSIFLCLLGSSEMQHHKSIIIITVLRIIKIFIKLKILSVEIITAHSSVVPVHLFAVWSA